MAKKYLLHRITEEDADYIQEETSTLSRDVRSGNCYLMVNKKNGKIFLENGRILIYKALGREENLVDYVEEDKHRFLEAIEACAFFRGYANEHGLNFKTSKISELLNELEDHEIEIPEGCRSCKIETTSNIQCTQEILDYISEAANSFDILNNLQRGLPALALYINRRNIQNPAIQENEEDFEIEEIEPDMDEEEIDDWF